MSERKGMDCIKCGGLAKPIKTSFQGNEIDGWKCIKCREVYYDPKQAQRILLLHKLEHEDLQAKLGKIRSNLILRIPKAVEESLRLKEGGTVKLRIKNATELSLSTG